MARFLTKDVYGQYQFVLSVLGLVAIFALPGMITAVIQAVAKWRDGTYFKSIKEVLKWNWLGSVVLVWIAIYWYYTWKVEWSFLFLILAVVFPLYSIVNRYKTLLSWKHLYDKQIKYTVIFDICSLIFLSIGAIFFDSSFVLVLIFVWCQIFINWYFTLFASKKYIKNDDFKKSDLVFGKKLTLVSVITIIAFQIDKLIVTALLGFEELAIYVIVTLMPDQVKSLFAPLTNMFVPKLSKIKDWIKTKKRLMRLFWFFFHLFSNGCILNI